MNSLAIKDIKTKEAFNSLLDYTDNEVKVLQNVKFSVKAKLEADKKNSREVIADIIAPITNFLDGFPLEQTWNKLNLELSNYCKTLMQDCDQLLRILTIRIDTLLNDKKESKAKLIEEKKKFDAQMKILRDNFDKQNRNIARKIKELTDLRRDYNDTRKKRKSVEDILRNASRLIAEIQHQHNISLIAFHELNEYNDLCSKKLFPNLFNNFQCTQEKLFVEFKNILTTYFEHIDSSNKKYSTFFKNIETEIQTMPNGDAYDIKFIANEIKGIPLVEANVVYDVSSLINSDTAPTNDDLFVLRLDNRTFSKHVGSQEQLNQKLIEYDAQLKSCEENSPMKEYYNKLIEIINQQLQSTPSQALIPQPPPGIARASVSTPSSVITEEEDTFDFEIKVCINHLIPINDQIWFHGTISRDDTPALLVKEGDFLVRESTRFRKSGNADNDQNEDPMQPSPYVISIFQNVHYVIFQNTQTNKYKIGQNEYEKITELIEHLMSEPNNEIGIQLKRPILRPDWSIKHEDIIMIDRLGAGNFGEVHKAYFKDKIVAVKMLKTAIMKHNNAFFLEAYTLQMLKHEKIVKFIGMAIDQNPLYMIMEYIDGGSLLSYLQRLNTDNERRELTTKKKLKLCLDCAEGMEYLENNKVIHRDLAARNCLIESNSDTNELVLKLSDFGLAKYGMSVYGLKYDSLVATKWAAIEALTKSIITHKSDVWSYGVTIWEIFNYGETPYRGLGREKDPMIRYLTQGNRLQRPTTEPDMKIYDKLMKPCWELEDNDRPNFTQIRGIINDLLNEVYINSY